MTTTEFSNGFDSLASSFRRFKDYDKREMLDSIEFDEYEKSLFLTLSQEEIVVGLYSGRNSFGESFETTEEMRRYLDILVKSKRYSTDSDSIPGEGVSEKSVFFKLPDDKAFIIMEQLTFSDESLGCYNGTTVNVQPTTHDEYMKIRNNPFRGSTERKALRLDSGNGVVEIISKYSFDSYFLRYLAVPEPIILENLPEGVTIKGQSEEHGCLLPEQLHKMILQRAVQMALASKGLTLNNNS